MKKGIYWRILIISLLAGGLIYYATASGVWGFSDSVAYLVSARNLSRGIGLGYYYPNGQLHVLTHYPPLFPAVLSIFYWLHLDALFMLRLLVIGMIAASIGVAGFCIVRFTSSPELAIPACLVLAVFPASVRMFSSAMSEPLFIFCWLCSTLMLLVYLRQPRAGTFWGAAAVTSLVPFTRYIGVCFLAANCLAVLLLVNYNWRVRFKKAIAFGLIASLPTLLWLIWIALNADQTLGGRSVSFAFAALLEKFKIFLGLAMETFMSRLPLRSLFAVFPYQARWILFGVMTIIFAAFTLTAFKINACKKSTASAQSSFNLWVVFSLGALFYFMGMILSYIFTWPVPDVNDRLLLPIFLGLIMAGTGAFDLWKTAWFQGWKKWLSILPWLGAGLLLISYWPITVELTAQTRKAGGFLENSWRNSETIQALRSLPAELVLISNSPPALLLWADRPAYDVLETLRPEFLAQNNIYGSDLQDISQQAFKKGGALVLFKSISLELNQAYGSDQYLSTLLQGLYMHGEYKDGAIYFAEPFFRVR